MTYDGTELKDTPFGDVWAQRVRIVEREEVVKVNNGSGRDYWCRVWSQTHGNVHSRGK